MTEQAEWGYKAGRGLVRVNQTEQQAGWCDQTVRGVIEGQSNS